MVPTGGNREEMSYLVLRKLLSMVVQENEPMQVLGTDPCHVLQVMYCYMCVHIHYLLLAFN